MASSTLLFPLALFLLVPLSFSDSTPCFTPNHFEDGILPTPHFSTRLPSSSSFRRLGSSTRRSGPPQKASSTPVSRSTLSTLGAHPRSFSSPLPSFLHLLVFSLPSLRLFFFHLPSSPPCPRFLRHVTLFFSTFVKLHSARV